MNNAISFIEKPELPETPEEKAARFARNKRWARMDPRDFWFMVIHEEWEREPNE